MFFSHSSAGLVFSINLALWGLGQGFRACGLSVSGLGVQGFRVGVTSYPKPKTLNPEPLPLREPNW